MKYDHVFSFGRWCATAIYLENRGLRSFSTPFDWLLADEVPFSGYADLVCNGFKGFMELESLTPVEGCPGQFRDRRTGMISVHDFRPNTEPATTYDAVWAKLSRRIARYLAAIGRSKNVLLVQCLRRGAVDVEDVERGLMRLRKRFAGTRFDAVILQHVAGLDRVTCAHAADGVTVWRGDFFDLTRPGQAVIGDSRLCGAIFGKLRAKGRVRNLLRLEALRLGKRLKARLYLTHAARLKAREAERQSWKEF